MLGQLGRRLHVRCEDCGMDTNYAITDETFEADSLNWQDEDTMSSVEEDTQAGVNCGPGCGYCGRCS